MKSHASHVLLPLLLLLSCNLTAEPQPIRLGVVAPLSGDYANHGQYIQRGVELAVESLQAEGAHIEVYYEDACLPASAVTSVKKLLMQKINAVVGSYCVIGMVPMAPFLEREGVLAFHTSAVPDAILNAGEYIFTTNVTIENEALELARLARESLHTRRAGIFSFPSDWGDDYSKYFSKEFKRLGGQVVASEMTQVQQTDFRSELLRMKSRGVDLIFAAHISSGLGNIVKQARELRMDVEVISTDEAEDPQFFKTAGAFAEGVKILVPEPVAPSPSSMKFLERYKRQFKAVPPVLSTNAYDATMLAVRALSRCELEHECARQEISRTVGYAGASGMISIDSKGGTVKPFVQKVAENGVFLR